MIRVLHVLSSVYTGAGVPNTIMNYYRHIDRECVQFDFLIFKRHDHSFEEEIRSLGGEVYYFTPPSIKNVKKTYSELNDFFSANRGKYDIVQLHDLYLSGVVFSVAKRYGIKKRVAHSHGTMYSEVFLKAVRNYILYLPLKYLSTDYFACSILAGEFAFGKRAVSKGKVKIVRNAIMLKKYVYSESIRKEYRNNMGIDSKIVIGHIGQLTGVKNHEFIIDVFEAVVKKEKSVHLVLVGDGDLRQKIEERIESSPLLEKKVSLLGRREDIERVLQAFDIFLFPSFREGFPLAVLEAQVSGLPCILSDTISDEVNVGNVKFLSLSHLEAWCDAVIQEIKKQPERRSRIKEATNKGLDIIKESEELLKKYTKIFSDGRNEEKR